MASSSGAVSVPGAGNSSRWDGAAWTPGFCSQSHAGQLGRDRDDMCVLFSGTTAPWGWLGVGTPSQGHQPPFPFPVTPADLQLSGMRTLEHVAVTVTITHPRRGNLEIRLFCPSGMMSLIGTTRSMDS